MSPKKVYGPKAVFKDGILGNFEPRNYGGKTGPGNYFFVSFNVLGNNKIQEFMLGYSAKYQIQVVVVFVFFEKNLKYITITMSSY